MRRPVGERVVKRLGVAASLVVVMPLLVFLGCAPLEPLAEPEVSDLQLTVETMKTAVRDAQRTVTELHAELEAHRKELAESQIARAQLEGRVREAERRVVEARQVVELQRDELAAARNERERIARAGRQLQGRPKQLQKQRTDTSTLQQGQADATPASMPSRSSANVSANRARMKTAPESDAVEPSAEPASLPQTDALSSQLRTISVRSGDTLWSIARRYQVDLSELRLLNELADNRILPGQALWLPAPRSAVRPATAMGITSGR